MDTRRTVAVTDSQLERVTLLTCRCVQWMSAVISLGISASFINKGPRILVNTYILIISAISVAAFAPAFATTFTTVRVLREVVILIDLAFSHLWLTAFIFTAFQFNKSSCHLGVHAACQTKFALEAFTFLTFIFTFFCLLLEPIAILYAGKKKYNSLSAIHSEKQSQIHSSPGMGPSGMEREPGAATATSPHHAV